jgi:DNA invertase Pin-like site-specific DNA recombinase
MGVKNFGYVRVSTSRQVHDRQDDALRDVGIAAEDIYRDTITGTRFSRPGLDELIGAVGKDGHRSGGLARESDTITVASLDRLGRSLSEIVKEANDLHRRGIVLRSLKESIDYSTTVGRMLAGIFGALAEYERELIHERAADARAAAKARGKQTGRPLKLTADQARQFCALHAGGESMSDLCKSFGISRPTGYRVLAAAAQVAA